MKDPIVVTALALNAPFGCNIGELWGYLRESAAKPGSITRFPVDGCRVKIARVHWPEQGVDCLFREAASTARHALAEAGVDPSKQRVGLSIGSISGMDIDDRPSRPESDAALIDQPANALGQFCHDQMALSGPLIHVTSACTSSAAAIYWGKHVLDRNDADAMIVGGADRIRAVDFAGFNILRAMDPGGTRPFHRDRRGITMGEGACFLVLERLSSARRRGATVLAILRGAGLSCDAHHATAPRAEGLMHAARQALAIAELAPSDIGYVNCHGTGTPANDEQEWRALEALFGDGLSNIYVGSTKGFTGHWLGTAGALEAAISVSALRHGRPPGMPWLGPGESIVPEGREQPDPGAPPLQQVMSNSLGFGGNNCSLIFSRVPENG